MDVEIVNVEQARAWDGQEGEDWAREHERYDASAANHHRRLLELLALSAGDRVLDVGCGTGLTTRDAARAAPSGHAHGVDLSSPMLERARELSARDGLTNTSFEQGDAQVHPFEVEAFDVAVSKLTAMFFADRVAAFANIARAIRPGGRLVTMTWAGPEHNEWFTATFSALAAGRELNGPPVGAPGPFGMADADQARADLGAAGFSTVEVERHAAPFRLGDDGDDAYRFFQRTGVFRGLTDGLDEERRRRAHADLEATMHAHDTGDGVWFDSAVLLVTAAKP